jgi:hypothetical protein
MASSRELIAENKRILLRALIGALASTRVTYGPHAQTAADQLTAEFTRRSRSEPDGPPPGHKTLPGLETSMGEGALDRCDPQRGHHSSPHRGCILR